MPRREKDTWANQLIEIVSAVRLLSRHNGASNDELAEELGLGERTVYRLKKTLEKMGIPLEDVEVSSGNRMRWRIPAQWTFTFPKTNDMGLTTPELLSLFALRVSAGLYSGSSIKQDLDNAFDKIGMTLSPASRTMLERYATLFLSVPSAAKDYSGSAEIIEDLSFAIIERTTCTIRYHSFSDDKIKQYDIQPLHFFEREGGLYLLVLVPTYGDVRTLAVERINAVETTGQPFAYPEEFDPEEYLASAFTLYFEEPVEVKIRFAADQVRYIRERVWAKGQTIQETEDGSALLTINTSGWGDIKRWVMAFGADAEVMEPLEMRQEIAAELSISLESYRQ